MRAPYKPRPKPRPAPAKPEPLTAADVFQTSCLALIKQGRQAVNGDGVCKYRMADGRKCAVGHLIRDDEYREDMEGKGTSTLALNRLLPLRLLPFLDLLWGLQRCHDALLIAGNFENWFAQIQRIASEHNLSTNAIHDALLKAGKIAR